MKIELNKKRFVFKFVIIAIILFITLSSVNKLYKSLYGTFHPFNMNTSSLAVTNIYKTNDKFLLFDEDSGSVAVAKYDDKKKTFSEIRNIKNEINIFNHILQLNDGKILFYYFNDKPTKRKLIFTIYDLEKETVLNQITYKNNADFWNIENIWAIGKDSFAFLTGKEQEKIKTENQELYIYKDGKIKRIKNTFDRNEGHKTIVKFNENIFGFIYTKPKQDNNLNLLVYEFNPKNNSFKQTDTTLIKESCIEANDYTYISNSNIITLSDNRFLLIHDRESKKAFSLFQIRENKIEKVFTKNYGKFNYLMQTAAFAQIGNDKILITGGYNGNPMFPRHTKNTYQLNLKTLEMKELNKAYYVERAAFKLNEDEVLLMSRLELFKKGILW